MNGRALARRIWIWAPLLAYLSLIFYLSSRSQVPWAASYPDKLLHGFEYAGLAVLTARALNDGLVRRIPENRLGIVFVACVAYGISDEFHQYFVPGRSSDYRDVLADACGTAIILAVLWLGQRTILAKWAA
jgi:VanZ family protein